MPYPLLGIDTQFIRVAECFVLIVTMAWCDWSVNRLRKCDMVAFATYSSMTYRREDSLPTRPTFHPTEVNPMNVRLRPSEDIAIEGKSKADAVSALERNTRRSIRQKRANMRMAGSFDAEIEPANVSDRTSVPVAGVCKDISRSGCRLVAATPLRVGDVYRVVVTDSSLDVPEMFCRCVRCSLLSETAFECGMSFFSQISLPGASVGSPQDLI